MAAANSRWDSTALQWHWRKFSLTLAAVVLVAPPLQASEWEFDDVRRVVAIADIHGAYAPMVKALRSAEVLDDDLVWSGADAHLVIVGDILDRGPDSRQAMDLLMRLEDEANAAGGRVHVLIGNHEAMNLYGDLRYVSASEYAAFADEEQPQDRERWFAAYIQFRASGTESPEALQALFEQRYPRGFFAHRRAFSTTGKYGEWLLSKPVVVVINGTAFVHGGLSPMIGEIGLDGVNGQLRGELIDYVRQLEVLYEAEVLFPTDAFHSHLEILGRQPLPVDASAATVEAVGLVKALHRSRLHALNGPLWYRGNVVCSELVETDKLAATLQSIGADRVVIGHTPTPGRQVLQRLDGRIIEIDTGMLNGYYGGSANALLIDDSGVAVVNQDNDGLTTPLPHPRLVGSRPSGTMSASEIEDLLRNGDVIARNTDAFMREVVSISNEKHRIDAFFVKNRSRKNFPEVAAYRLDRMIDLDMVPVTVRRELDGVDGSLQFKPDDSMDELARQREGRGTSAWCPLPEQWNAMFVFDALIHNNGRNSSNILYNLDLWQLMLVGHDEAFPTRKGVPSNLESVPYEVGQGWKDALAPLDEATLQQKLGDVLDAKRVRALAARSEALIESD